MRWLLVCALAALTASLWTYERARAAGGSLDSSFGGGSGAVITDFNADGEAYALAVQADGKIVVAGRSRPDSNSTHISVALARYNSDGALDATFGSGGKVLDTAQPSQAYAVAVQPDGKILTTNSGSANVTRFNADGSLDTTFGASGRTGFLLVPFAMILQPDGKILVGGYFRVSYQVTNFAVGRYNSDGTVDTSFGAGGKVTTEFYRGHDEIHALALQPDGKIVAAGQASSGGSNYYAVLARYDGKGNLDTSFGSGGKVSTDFSPDEGMKYHRLFAVAVRADGKVVAAGATRHYDSDDSLALARYNADGSADVTFGNAGQLTTKVLGLNASASGLALEPGGKFFVGGCATSSYDCSGGGGAFALAHYNSDGSPDTAFGSQGAVVTQIGGSGEYASAIALQGDGKVLLAGSSKYASANCCDYNFALARYIPGTSTPTPTPTPVATPTPTPTTGVPGQPDIVWSSTYPVNVTSVAYAPDGQTVFSSNWRTDGGRPGNLWRASDGSLLRSVFVNETGCGEINRVAYSPDGQIMATITGCSTRLWRVADGTLIRKITSGGGANANLDQSSVAFSPDGLLVATTFSSSYRTGIVKLWSVADGTLIRSMTAGGYSAVRFSPDGQIVAAVGKLGLDLWRVADGSLIRHIEGVTKALAFSPDGQLLATAGLPGGEFSEDDTIELYRVSDGTLARELRWVGGVTSVAFTPDGQALVSAGWESNQGQDSTFGASNGTLRFWRVSDGALLKTYDHATSTSVKDVAVSPDGRFFVYASGTSVTLARVPDISASACTFSINPRRATIPCEGGGGSVEVSAADSCSWNAASRVNWIKITSGTGGSGNGVVNYTLASNGCNAVPGSGLMSEGLLTIGEQTFVVNQMLATQSPTPTPTPTPTLTPTPTPTPSTGGLQYYPLAHPVRLLDTRPGEPACDTPGAQLLADTSRTQAAVGTCGGLSIPSTAKAVVGNAAVVNNHTGAGAGYVTLYPNGVARPVAANVNYVAGDIVSNGFTVGLGAGGAFDIYAYSSLHVVIDIAGYYAPPGQGGLYYHPLPSPVRLLDTRIGQPACDSPGSPIQGDSSRNESARTTCGGVLLPDDAQAITGNAAVVNNSQGAGAGHVTLYPGGVPRPVAANVNYAPGQIVSNAFNVGLGADGTFNINASTTTDIVVDVTGYYSASASPDANGVAGLLFYPLAAPMRLLDTRPGEPACVNPGSPLAANAARTQNARITCGSLSVPANALAVVGNAAVVNTTSGAGAGYVTVYPGGVSRPVAANVNYGPGQIVSNAYTVGLGADGAFNIYAYSSLHFVTDISGYFAP